METVRYMLAVNVGSSSVKYALFDAAPSGAKIATGKVASDVAFDAIMRAVAGTVAPESIAIVAHRVVSGGPKYPDTAKVDDALVATLNERASFDPDHIPAEVGLIQEFRTRLPMVPQIACFDTAFFADLPRVAQLVPIPRKYLDAGVRRYGFHGLSYAHILKTIAKEHGEEAASGRIVMAHLGSGASLAAVKGGKPFDTSMGFTPTSGVPMSTRSGDLDPGVVWYLSKTEGMEAEAFNEMVNHKSGLLGISDVSDDMYYLLEHEAFDPRCVDAVTLFCYEVKKRIGAFAAAMGGLDMLVFSGGMAQEAPRIRRRVCEGLEFLGISLDKDRNEAQADIISYIGNHVPVLVIRSDEESTMGDEARRFL